MPYADNASLPASVRKRYSERCQTVWREVWNKTYANTPSESKAAAFAHTAAANCESSRRSLDPAAARSDAMTEIARPAVKLVDETDDAWIIEGLILPIGGPIHGQDLTGTHFTKDTDFALDWFPDGGRPGLYRHGFDPELGISVVGREIKSWSDDRGRWLRAQIDKAHEYAAEIKQLLDEGLLSLSSGAVDHLVQIASKSGEIIRWPWVEWSLVPNPANPEAVVYQVKSADAIEHLGVLGIKAPAELAVPAAKESEAAEDATSAAWILGSLIDLLGDECDEAQAARLRAAIEALQGYIAAEVAEVGTPEDIAETAQQAMEDMMGGWMSRDRAIREGRRNSAEDLATIQSIHDASTMLGADCAGGSGKAADTAPAHVLAVRAGDDVEPVTPADLAAIRELLIAAGVETARRTLGL